MISSGFAVQSTKSARTTTEDIVRSAPNPLLEPMQGTEHQRIAGVQLDIARAGTARVKRVIYPAGFHWSTHIKPIVGTTTACIPTSDFWRMGKFISSSPTAAAGSLRRLKSL